MQSSRRGRASPHALAEAPEHTAWSRRAQPPVLGIIRWMLPCGCPHGKIGMCSGFSIGERSPVYHPAFVGLQPPLTSGATPLTTKHSVRRSGASAGPPLEPLCLHGRTTPTSAGHAAKWAIHCTHRSHCSASRTSRPPRPKNLPKTTHLVFWPRTLRLPMPAPIPLLVLVPMPGRGRAHDRLASTRLDIDAGHHTILTHKHLTHTSCPLNAPRPLDR